MRCLWSGGLLFVAVASLGAQNPKWGSFQGTVRTDWSSDGRTMRLVDEFKYIDPLGSVWVAPTDAEIDGASIPRPFWSFIGGPFEGQYRNASVVHDVACKEKKNTWQKVHQMFYVASLAGGVDEVDAKIMYGAVYHFGPRWGVPTVRSLKDDDDFLRMREYIRRNSSISLEAIEKLTSDLLREVIRVVPPPIRIAPRSANSRNVA